MVQREKGKMAWTISIHLACKMVVESCRLRKQLKRQILK